MLADNGPLMVMRQLDLLHADDHEKLERFSHKQSLMLFLDGDDALEKVRGDEPFCHSGEARLTLVHRTLFRSTTR